MYKIVRNIDGIRRSALQSPLEITYNVEGEWTKAPEKNLQHGYGILIFGGYIDACRFILATRWLQVLELWRVDAGKHLELPRNNLSLAEVTIAEAQTILPEWRFHYGWPSGTRACDAIRMQQLIGIFPAARG